MATAGRSAVSNHLPAQQCCSSLRARQHASRCTDMEQNDTYDAGCQGIFMASAGKHIEAQWRVESNAAIIASRTTGNNRLNS